MLQTIRWGTKRKLHERFGEHGQFAISTPVVEYINADDIIAFCLYLMNKIPRKLIKIRSCAILRDLTGLTDFLVSKAWFSQFTSAF